jgi:hypothetical protein
MPAVEAIGAVEGQGEEIAIGARLMITLPGTVGGCMQRWVCHVTPHSQTSRRRSAHVRCSSTQTGGWVAHQHEQMHHH